MNKVKSLGEWIITIVVAIVIFFIINQFVCSVTLVKGNSMNPTLMSNDRVLINRTSLKVNHLTYGNIIELKAPDDVKKHYIKRVIALPGDTVEINGNDVYVNGRMIYEPYAMDDKTYMPIPSERFNLQKDEYFVLGDNRDNSNDSRHFGVIKKDAIIGVAILRFFPSILVL